MWSLAFILILLLSPLIIGVGLAVIFKKPRSDILALLVSSFLLLIVELLVLKLRVPFSRHSLLPENVTTIILLTDVLATITGMLIIPFILTRWGIEAVDYIRSERHALIRQESKGNTILGILFGVWFVLIIAQSLSTSIESSVPAYYKARYEALQRHALEHK
ncbi:MAG: hypothetical protein A2283_20555 [Lentisphaerae bacterium RIFOXYA12_FULL_48_11]|nr:MAG: hypothetical protein A2283_20555 [Lentisphaerae bacterium RIFOXYA12_FULL_48_11]